jgi:putative addiction module component (TIGR02574 family)
MSVTAIQDEILGLPATERARLIDVLWHSISAPEQQAREAAWAAESERRKNDCARCRRGFRRSEKGIAEVRIFFGC